MTEPEVNMAEQSSAQTLPASPAVAPTPDPVPEQSIPPVAAETIADPALDTLAPTEVAPAAEASPPAETINVTDIGENTFEKTAAPQIESSQALTTSRTISDLTSPAPFSNSAQMRAHALRARQSKRDAKLARIVEFARNRGSVRNDDIKNILRVSDATATRYARLLVQRGEIIQSGKGRSVTYSLRR